MNTHVFAFYSDFVNYIHNSGSRLDIHELMDQDLVHRISIVLRLDKGDRLILFNTRLHVEAVILGIKPKKSIVLEIQNIKPNILFSPKITWLLPLLKREAFEEAIYALTELGAQVIQPVITNKTQRAWNEKELVRAEKIIMAAAEQSKNYSMPDCTAFCMALD